MITCASGYTASGSGIAECGASMGRLSQVPTCVGTGGSGENEVRIVYVHSKIALTDDITDATVLMQPRFKTVMTESIAASLRVTTADVEIIRVLRRAPRRLLTMRRYLAAMSVDVEFRVKAANSAAQSALTAAITTNKSTFTNDISTQVTTKSAAASIPLSVSSVDADPATVVTVYDPPPIPAPSPAPSPAPTEGSSSDGDAKRGAFEQIMTFAIGPVVFLWFVGTAHLCYRLRLRTLRRDGEREAEYALSDPISAV
eukprot:GEMP01050737.1.p2 GENE.GEMP01050737.1~~GEMP01050737.1.p2  ORF type:complete len:257 (+),score=50.95 GEMP01050737.1:549-1319(+)